MLRGHDHATLRNGLIPPLALIVIWSAQRVRNPDTHDLVLEAVVGADRIPVHVHHAALELADVETCKRIAEKKILGWMSIPQVPRRIDVTAGDIEDL